MKIAICGGTGFVGGALVDYWLQAGHHVKVITRKLPDMHNPSKTLHIYLGNSLKKHLMN